MKFSSLITPGTILVLSISLVLFHNNVGIVEGGDLVTEVFRTIGWLIAIPTLPPLVFVTALFAGCNRRLQEHQSESWFTAKEVCSSVLYDLQLIVETQTGHLLLYATPSLSTTTKGNDDDVDIVDQDVCFNFIIHSLRDPNNDNDEENKYAYVQMITEEMEQEFYQTTVSYDLHVQRSFSTIANAVETVTLDVTTHYTDSAVPTNCGTYLLELAKYLQIPIEDDEMISFVLMNMKDASFTRNFITSSTYRTLTGEEGWFDSAVAGTTTTATTDAESSERILRRLGEYMFEQQYPNELRM